MESLKAPLPRQNDTIQKSKPATHLVEVGWYYGTVDDAKQAASSQMMELK